MWVKVLILRHSDHRGVKYPIRFTGDAAPRQALSVSSNERMQRRRAPDEFHALRFLGSFEEIRQLFNMKKKLERTVANCCHLKFNHIMIVRKLHLDVNARLNCFLFDSQF